MADLATFFGNLAQHFIANEKLYATCIAYTFMLFGAVHLFSNIFTKSHGRHYSKGYQISPNVAWAFPFLPSIAIPLLLIAFGERPASISNYAVALFYVIHYSFRTFYGISIRGGKPTPLFFFLTTIYVGITNGYAQARYSLKYADHGPDWITSPLFILGMVMAVTGLAINVHSDTILRNLRQSGESGYKIPKGGLFEYVSCANYFGEIVEWIGYAIAANHLAAFSLAVFSFSYLVQRGREHHRFYKEKFEDYPKNRRVIIPFLF